MTIKNNRPAQAAELRDQAEAKWSERSKKTGPLSATESDTRRLVHELQVHQIELEMQNEELMQSRVETEAALRQYTDLYDFAPVGYFTLARDGAIRQANLAGANLLGVERRKLIKRRFGLFVSVESRPAFSAFLEKVFTGGSKEACEITLLKDGPDPLWAHMEASTEDKQECRAVVVDTTARKRAEEELTIVNKELAFQNEEKEKRAAELIIANKELVYQNEEKEKRAAELVVVNKELIFQNEEKEQRAAELIIANKELVYQNEEKEKRAAELDAIFKTLPYLVSLHGKDGQYLRVNPTIVNTFGFDPTKASRKEIAHRLRARFPDGQPLTSKNMPSTRALAGEAVHNIEYIITDVNGNEHTLLYNAIPWKVNGELQGAVFAQEDITDRKEAEKALLKKEKIEKRLLEQQIATNQLALLLGESLNLENVYQTLGNIIRRLVDVWCFIISSYNEQTKEIRAEYVESDHVVDVSKFPPIPLGKPGEGTLSQVIHTGQPLYTPDHHLAVAKSKMRYTIEDDGSVHKELPSEKDQEDTTRSSVYLPMKLNGKVVGILQLQSHRLDAYSKDDIDLLSGLANEASVAIQNARLHNEVLSELVERKRAEEQVRQNLSELEMLYSTSLASGNLLQPKEIAQKLVEILSEKFQWHHATIHSYHPESETIELLAFHQPGLENEAERLRAEERFKTRILHPGQGFLGWVTQHGLTVYCGDVTKDPRYLEVWPGMHSGMYIPLKVGEHTIGCLSVESERVNAFTERDEWLITILATQAASALENARLFEETRQRLVESDAVNKILIALRTAESLDKLLSAFLDETLTLLGTQPGAIWLYDKDSQELGQAVSRGWFTQLPKTPVKPGEGLVGTTFATGKSHLAREFVRDPDVLDANLGQIPAGWGGVCEPIRSAQAVVGVMLISVQLPRELTTGERQVLNTLAEIVGTASQRLRLHEQTESQLQHLQALHEIDTVIAASFDLSFTLDTFLKNVLAQLHVDAASILLQNPHTRMLEYSAGKGFRMPGIEQLRLSLSEGYAGQVVYQRHIVHSEDLPADNTSPAYTKLIDNEGFVSYYGVPLLVKGEVKGVLEIFHRTPLKPNADWLDFMKALAGQAAIAIDSSLTYDNLQRSNMELILTYDRTLEGWARALDMRDKETEGHSKRVTEMTLQLARNLAVRDEEMEHIRRGALLHDMGKMGIPDSILLKPGPLTPEEWEVMRTHPTRAYEMLAPIPYLRLALEIPYCHHEKWDGSGYPRGLKGEEIPLAARIFAVVDVYDALTSDRPYRLAWTREKALEHIREQSGKQFDPKVVKAFMDLMAGEK